MAEEWFSAAEIASLGLPGIPGTERGVRALADRAGWQCPEKEWSADNPCGSWRKRTRKGGGVEYHVSVLPGRTQLPVIMEAAAPVETREKAKATLAAADMWAWFERQKDKVKEKAKGRLSTLDAVEALIRNGQKKEVAVPLVATAMKVAPSSIWNWYHRVAGQDRADWLPFLADRYVGKQAEAEFTPEAWEAFKGDYLRQSGRPLSACYRTLERLAAEKGWTIPSEKSVARRIAAEIATPVLVLAREGKDALKKLYPAQERDRSCFHALEAINGDGHKWDVNVEWPDGEKRRPLMVVFQDLYSNKVLAWRVAKTENREAIRLALGDVVEQYGIPEHIWFDNTFAFANKWLTGGAAHRFRYKVRDEDPVGICETLGIQVHFTLPYSGQSKPVERVFRDFAHDIAKVAAFEGAYTGHSPDNKPANYGERAVPLDEFLRVVSVEIAAWNARQGRRTRIAQGRSFDDVFADSYTRSSSQGLIRRGTPEQARLWLLAAEGVRADADCGAVSLLGNRFWSEWMTDHRGDKLIIRFDPQNVLDGLFVYNLAGAFLGKAEVLEAAGFKDADAAREHGRARRAYLKATEVALAAQRKMSAIEVAAMQPDFDPAPVPDAGNVHRAVFGNTALKAKPEEFPALSVGQQKVAVFDAFARGVAKLANE